MSLFRRKASTSIFKRQKHSKLGEQWDENKEPVRDGINFHLKYIGSVLLDDPSSRKATAAAIKNIISMAKSGGRKYNRVMVNVSPHGIKVIDQTSNELHLDVSIYRISYCSADATHDHVVAFIATNKNETVECHAFLCPKRKVAQAVAVTIAQSFNLAFETWQMVKKQQRLKIEAENYAQTNSNGCVSEASSSNNSNGGSTECSPEGKPNTNVQPLIDLGSSQFTTLQDDNELDASFTKLVDSNCDPFISANIAEDEEKHIVEYVHSAQILHTFDDTSFSLL